MKNNKAFTLIEVLAVIIIVVSLFLIVVPTVINKFSNQKENVSEVTEKLIVDATKMYIKDNDISLSKTDKNYIEISELVDQGYLESPVKNPNNIDEDITKTGKVEIKYTDKFEYKVLVINEINYIESTGTQYIDTNCKINNNFTLQFRTNIGEGTILGVIDDVTAFALASAGSKDYFRFYSEEGRDFLSGNQGDSFEIYIEKNSIYVDGEIKYTEQNHMLHSFNLNLYLFARNNKGIASGTVVGEAFSNRKLYYMKIWDDNNNLVRDFIPVLDKENVPCLYDKVEGKYYYNQGTGEFLYE